MAGTTGAAGSLIGIRSAARPARPGDGLLPDVAIVVSADGGAPDLVDRLGRLVRDLDQAGEPFEILITAGDPEGGSRTEVLASIDPRVKLVPHRGPPGLRGSLRAAAGAARAEFLSPCPPSASMTSGEIRALREAMEPFSAYSYLPGSPAADVAMIVRTGRMVRGLVTYAMVRLYASDLGGPFMFRRSLLERMSIDSDGPEGVLELAVRARRGGSVVREVLLPSASRATAPSIADVWRLRRRLRAPGGS